MNEETYRGGFLAKLKNFTPFCLLDNKHPETEHVCLLSIYSAKGNTKLKHNHGTARVSYHSTNIL
jgi:ligand-binding sensor protein